MATQCNGVIIGYNTLFGNDAQPLYAAGSPDIACVIEIEAMAQANIQKAIFGSAAAANTTDVELANIPGASIENPIVKQGYSASSGQAYIVHNLTYVGKYSG